MVMDVRAFCVARPTSGRARQDVRRCRLRALNLPARILHTPSSRLACSYLAYALVKGDDPQLFAELVREASARTCGRALVFSLHDGDPLVDTARHMAAWRYESEFMTVTYGADPNGFTGVPYIEAGAL